MYRWWTGPWQHCSVSCGDKGIHRRTVICVRSLGSDEQIALEDSVCGGLDKPVEVEPCHHKDPCPGLGVWTVAGWSNVSCIFVCMFEFGLYKHIMFACVHSFTYIVLF